MPDTRSPPLATSLPPGRRPWLPENGREPTSEGWRPSESPGAGFGAGRESRRGRVLPDRTVIQDALQRRPPPASLLRPKRGIGRWVVLGAVLLLAGGTGGLAVGLSLRPDAPAPQRQRAEIPAAAALPTVGAPVAAEARGAGAVRPDAAAADPAALALGGPLKSSSPQTGGSDVTRPAPAPPSGADGAPDGEALRKTVAAEQARLEALAQARAAAEAQLAQLQAQVMQREILARREAALATLPSVTSPLPRQQRPAEPREAGAGGNAAPGAAAPHHQQQRVVLHHRAGSYAASEAAGAMAAQVREAGFELNETRAVSATPSQRVVRYFHSEDAPAAARLAGRLGRGWALQDFRSYEPLPSVGLLEVWLPDR